MIEVLVALGVFLLGILVFGGCVFAVRRFVNFSVLQPNNEAISHYLGIVVGVYGIFSGFVIVSLWEQQRQAEENLVHEASELRTIFRLAGQLSSPQGEEIKKATIAYAASVQGHEWNKLQARDKELSYVHPEKDRIWELITEHNDKNNVFFGPIVEHFEALSVARRNRCYDALRTLPAYLWMILIIGSLLSVACTLFIGTENLRTQALLTGISGGLLVLILFVVQDLQHPFGGYWSATTLPFEQAQNRMKQGLE